MGEVLLLLLLALLILGPARLPEYTRRLAQGARRLRTLTDDARGRLSDELGPDFGEIDWTALDPRRYDPRRIVREAFAGQSETSTPGQGATAATTPTATTPTATAVEPSPPAPQRRVVVVREPGAPTPFDPEAT